MYSAFRLFVRAKAVAYRHAFPLYLSYLEKNKKCSFDRPIVNHRTCHEFSSDDRISSSFSNLVRAFDSLRLIVGPIKPSTNRRYVSRGQVIARMPGNLEETERQANNF